MNLYKNFGTLMETMAEGCSSTDFEAGTYSNCEGTTWIEKTTRRSNLLVKSESEDSGVEEPPATPQDSEKSFSPTRYPSVTDSLTPPSPPPTCTPPASTVSQISLHRLQNRVEQALRRTQRANCGQLQERLPRHSVKQKLEPPHCPQEPDSIQRDAEAETQVGSEKEDSWNLHLQGLSPGLAYLERVCRLLEEIARLRKKNQELESEQDMAQEQLRHRETEDLLSRKCLCCAAEAANQEPEVKQNGDMINQLPSEEKHLPLIFRRRSMSDSQTLRKHVAPAWRKIRQETYGSTRLLAEDEQNRDSHPDVRMKTNTRKVKDTTDESYKEPDSRQTSSTKEKRTKHRFSQFFKRRSKNKSMT